MNSSRKWIALLVGGTLAGSLSSCAIGGASGSGDGGSKSVTVYSADGLHDGSPSWYKTEFAAFTKATGIKVNYIEAGSAEVVSRANKEKGNPQADVLVTLPPFMQSASKDGLLEKFTPDGADQIDAALKDKGGTWYAVVNNYADFIYNKKELKNPPKTPDDLLDPSFKGKIQYWTPGQSGDGTAVVINMMHMMGGQEQAMAYFGKLQKNNVGPSSSTGKLTSKVNHGDLLVANGDVQMNTSQLATNPNVGIFFLADDKGAKTTFPLPYDIGLIKDGPHTENGKKFINFLLSKEAQQNVSSDGSGFSVRNDVEATDPTAKKLHALMKDVTVWNPDWDTINTQVPQLVQAWQKATGS